MGRAERIAVALRPGADAGEEWDEWQVEEVPFLLSNRPWERAHFVAATGSRVPHDAGTEVAVAVPD